MVINSPTNQVDDERIIKEELLEESVNLGILPLEVSSK